MKKVFVLKYSHVIASILSLSALLSIDVFASGYAVREVSSSLLGSSFAGASTSKEDISSMHFNPATLSLMDTNQIYLVGTGIFPQISVDDAIATDPFGNIIYGESEENDHIGRDEVVPAAFFGWDLCDLKLGLALTSPWGLSTKYNDDWVGSLYAIESELKSADINPVISYNFTKEWAVAAGFVAQYLNADLTSDVFVPVSPDTGIELFNRIKGHGWGYGWNVGTVLQATPQLRVGLGFQSKITTDIHGTSELTDMRDQNASTSITTPEKANLGITYDMTAEWSIMGDIQYTHWERFNKLVIKIDDVDFTTNEDWDDSWFYAIGLNYRPGSNWIMRLGAAYDETPIRNDEDRTPRIPDQDRIWTSVGFSYFFADCTRFDLGYAHIFVKDANVELIGPDEQSLEAQYTSSIDIVSAGINFMF